MTLFASEPALVPAADVDVDEEVESTAGSRRGRRRRWVRRWLRWGVVTGLAVALLGVTIWLRTRTKYSGRVVGLGAGAPERPVAIVFGAGVGASGRPSAVLRDRVLTAVALYEAGAVRKILMSGDNSRKDYDESTAMKRLAVEAGVPAEDVVLDYAGFRTYDTCYRARDIFGVTSAVLVTQRFHLPRALYVANELGIDAVGVPADRRTYRHRRTYAMREVPACILAWVQVHVTRPRPRFLGRQEPIFTTAAPPRSRGARRDR